MFPNQWIVETISDGYILHRPKADLKKVFIEATTRCNLHCVNCVRNAWDENLEDMSSETFEHIMEGLKELPELREVYFGGFGEPLLHPRILEMIEAVKSLGVRVSMSTNGTLLDEQKAEALIDLKVDRIFVSMDSTQAQLFGELRGGADFDLVVENVMRLRDIRERKGYRIPTIGLEFVLTRRNFGEVSHLPKLAKKLGASIILLTHLLPYTEVSAKEIAYGENGIELPRPEGWAVMAGDYVMWGTMSTPRSKWGATRRCRFIEDKGVVIAWDGGVSPCYALMHSYPYFVFGAKKKVKRYVLGNVNEKKLSEIWKEREYVLFRSKVRDFRFPSCVDCGANCDLRQANEDCWTNDPSCADCLWAQDIIRCP
ncbi:MAG: tungsten cofactor oxidoreductase radical SAM maturase [Methanomassiliicoccales archaeon]|nr:tungsten cofactor oxidoreductase radical SAM maturase [Methanomassiliicoccales archaeon]